MPSSSSQQQQQQQQSRFAISPPTTTNDDGSPSESCVKDVDRVVRLIEDERHICALTLLQSIRQRLETPPIEAKPHSTTKRLRLRKSKSSAVIQEKQQDHDAAKELLIKHKALIRDLEELCKLFEKAKQNLNVNDDWTLAQTLFGVTTYYRREGDGSLSIKLEGDLEGVPLFDQVAVLREVDLHYLWAPFCSSSLTVAHLAKLDTVGWFVVGLPQFGLMRDACFRVVGSDSILEDGSILLVGQGIADRPQDGAKALSMQQGTAPTAEQSQQAAEQHEFEYLIKDPVLKELELPEPPTRLGSGRMTLRKFQAIIHVESPMSAKTRIIANVDPNLPLIPQSLLDFLMKKLCGVLLSKLQGAAKKVSKDPIKNLHACKMREEEAFYKGWLMPKFQSVCDIRGWQMSPFSAFELTDQQLELANAAEAKRNRNKSIKLFHSLSGDKLDHHLENNNSSHTEPANVGSPIRALSESDSVSALSHNSGSTFFTIWKNNPVAAYMREVEEKTELRKVREVEKSRERAANRLKPKSLDHESSSRLKELQEARKRRNQGLQAAQPAEYPADATRSQREIIKMQHKKDWATFWTSHDAKTRVVVIAMLVSSLFSLLYMDPLFQAYMASRHGNWWGGFIRSFATIVYLVVSAVVHFTLCYVALMYAFSSLQIGSIAGREAKRYYSENIHLIVGISSGSMLVLGVIKATLVAVSRWLTWQFALAAGFVMEFCGFFFLGGGFGLAIPDSMDSTMETIFTIWNKGTLFLGSVYSLVFGTISTCGSLVQSILVDSNPVGRGVMSFISAIFAPFVYIFVACNNFVNDSIAHHGGDQESISWREDTYATTRALLAYSAFFLLVLLMLFSLQAKSARGASSSPPDRSNSSVGGTSANSSLSATNGQTTKGSKTVTRYDSEVSELSTDSPGENAQSPRIASANRHRSNTRSLSPAFDTIEEGSDEEGAANGARSLGSPSKRKQKGRGFFKKSSKASTPSKPSTASM